MPDFGPNDWLVEEMYQQYRDDPLSVSESWRDFFADYRPQPNGATEPAEATPPVLVRTTRTPERDVRTRTPCLRRAGSG